LIMHPGERAEQKETSKIPVRFRKNLIKLVIPTLLIDLAILGAFPNAHPRSARVPRKTTAQRALEKEAED